MDLQLTLRGIFSMTSRLCAGMKKSLFFSQVRYPGMRLPDLPVARDAARRELCHLVQRICERFVAITGEQRPMASIFSVLLFFWSHSSGFSGVDHSTIDLHTVPDVCTSVPAWCYSSNEFRMINLHRVHTVIQTSGS
jgi:hypothetical protein